MANFRIPIGFCKGIEYVITCIGDRDSKEDTFRARIIEPSRKLHFSTKKEGNLQLEGPPATVPYTSIRNRQIHPPIIFPFFMGTNMGGSGYEAFLLVFFKACLRAIIVLQRWFL